MKTLILLLVVIIAMVASSAIAGRINESPIYHQMVVFQSYSSQPGILSIEPGNTAWRNFIGVAHNNPSASYTIKNVSLTKSSPGFAQCVTDAAGNPVFAPHKITQQGTPDIRLWWPLLYETPGTTFTLTILYGTPTPPWAHVEQWTWIVDANFDSVASLLDVFHNLPSGTDEVPIIDDPLYSALMAKIAAAKTAYNNGDIATAGFILADFELEVMDECVNESTVFPNPGVGISNTNENPACCMLLVDIEYILKTTGIGQLVKN